MFSSFLLASVAAWQFRIRNPNERLGSSGVKRRLKFPDAQELAAAWDFFL